MNFLRLKAMGDLCARYVAVLRSAWSIRRQLDTPARLEHELAFLPAQLELVETPVHPAPRCAMRSIMSFTAIVLLIGIFGRLDIVVSATGKFVPDARIKVIQPAMTGVVREILVHDGQQVRAGQLLMKLDTTQAAADADKAWSSKLDAELGGARARALLTAELDERPPVVTLINGTPQIRMQEAQRLAEGAFREYEDKIGSARAELSKRQAELDSTREEVAKLQATAPLARQQADVYKSLAGDKYVAQTDYLDKEQAALGQEHELLAQQNHARELAAGIAEQRADIASASSKFRSDQLDELEKNTQQVTQSRDDETKAQTRQALLSLTAPVAGTVQQLAAHTLGGVVTTAQDADGDRAGRYARSRSTTSEQGYRLRGCGPGGCGQGRGVSLYALWFHRGDGRICLERRGSGQEARTDFSGSHPPLDQPDSRGASMDHTHSRHGRDRRYQNRQAQRRWLFPGAAHGKCWGEHA
jgi:hemolysin D